MATQYKKAKIPGIRYREHPSRKAGIRKDRYYSMFYQLNGKQKEEGVGWLSQGWTERKVAEQLFEIKNNIKLGKHPQTLKEKREMAEQAKKEQEIQEIETISERITLQEAFEEYLKVHKMETTPSTWQSTVMYYNCWISKPLGTKKLTDISVKDIQDVITKASEKLASRSVLYVKAVLRQIFNFAKKRDLYFKDNPAMKVKIKMKDNKRTRFLNQDEAKALLEELKKHSVDVHDIALLSLYSGMRAGEIFNLQWEHVIWHSDRIAIVDPKNGEGRMQPMHPLVKEMLQKRYYTDKDGYVFKSEDGGKINKISRTFERTVKAMGFNDKVTDPRQKVVFHTLRHTHASWLVMNGVDLYTTQKLMGHKSNQMTQRYAHLAPGYLEKAVNSLESI